jgi:long-subunit fatty acid transport protein
LTAGTAYDTSPVNARNRIASLPIDEQIRYNACARYHVSESLVVGSYFNYTDLGSAKIEEDFWASKYSSNKLDQFQIFANWIL